MKGVRRFDFDVEEESFANQVQNLFKSWDFLTFPYVKVFEFFISLVENVLSTTLKLDVMVQFSAISSMHYNRDTILGNPDLHRFIDKESKNLRQTLYHLSHV